MKKITLVASFSSFLLLVSIPSVSSAQQTKDIPLTPPSQTPAVVEAAAKNLAHSIVDRKTTFDPNHLQGNDPHGYFAIQADKLVVFALAGATDPQRGEPV